MQLFDWAGLAATTLTAGLLQAASGFGFAVTAAPLFLFFIGPARAVQLVLILTAASSMLVFRRLSGAADRGLLLRLILGCLAGLPLGILVFRLAAPQTMRIVIGAAILIFAGGFAIQRFLGSARVPRTRALDVAAGVVSGITAAIIGISGPPVVLYLLLAGAAPARLRATLLAYFSLCYSAAIAFHAVGVGIPLATWSAAAILVPFAWGGGVLGRRLGDRLGPRGFAVFALVLLTASGGYTLAAALGFHPAVAGQSAAGRDAKP